MARTMSRGFFTITVRTRAFCSMILSDCYFRILKCTPEAKPLFIRLKI